MTSPARLPWRTGALLGMFLWGLAAGRGLAAVSVDSGQDASDFARVAAEGGRDWWDGGWVRLRDMSGLPAPNAAEDARFQGLAALRQLGARPIVFFAPAASIWFGETRRTAGKPSYPLDLGEAYAYAERMAIDAWPNVAAWEIGNEPDLFWTNDNAATYAAYLKAVALGLRAGIRAAEQAAAPRDPRQRAAVRPAPTLILNGALAMTPGPFLEQLAANDAFNYLDGFNWHFYGYAEDFTAQYRQFENAVGALTAVRAGAGTRTGARLETKSLPVFLTEYGYSLMSPAAAQTTEGRVRQWRWFKTVTEQMQALRVAGPVAFYLPPFFDGHRSEFGLAMKPGKSPAGGGGNFTAGGLSFTPADFGAAQTEPWMRRIGAAVGGNEASPALAWLVAQPAPSHPRDWPVTVAEPSPVVIDFVPDGDLQTLKSWHGYLLQPGAGAVRTGGGELRVYNFSGQTLTGRLKVSAPAELETALAPPGGGELTLAPFALVRVPVRLRLTADALRAFAWEVGFEGKTERTPPSVFATKFFPNAATMAKETVFRFDHPAEAATENRRLLLDRPLAGEEPRLHASGRWLVSDGVAVEETAGNWRFNVTARPPQPLRPPMAELPLPDDFKFPDAHLLLFDHRLGAAPAGTADVEFDCYFRTANGNLFEVIPRPDATAAWHGYAQAKENFTGMSFGRMNLPWRFAENRAVALVFFFRPRSLPVTLEVRGAELARFRVK